MTKRKKQIRKIFLVFSLLITSLLLLLTDTMSMKDKEKNYNVSVIIREKNAESYIRVRQGMEQAALDMNVNLSFITLSEDNSVSEQIELLQREINNDARAIVISPADYNEIAKPIESIIKKIPVVLIESKVNLDIPISYISSDNYDLGVALAEEVIQRGNSRKKILIVNNSLDSSGIKEREKGFIEAIEGSKNTYSFFEVSGDEGSINNELKNKIINDHIDIIVSFDPQLLELIGKIKKELQINNDNLEVFGSGVTSKIISYLEEDIVNAIGVENEFNIGYLSIRAAVDKIKGKRVTGSEINWTIINNRNMYLDENQRLLFPFVR